MFNPTQIVIDAFVERIGEYYKRSFGTLEPGHLNILSFFGRMSLEQIANSDAPYHDLDHTILVTEVAQLILKGKHMNGGDVKPNDWLHFTIASLCHDIGYVRGICKDDHDGKYVINQQGKQITLPEGSTDAALGPYHVDRSIIFATEWFSDIEQVDTDRIAKQLEYTRFPVPDDPGYHNSDSYPGLLRSADLIGQLGDINYTRKSSALYQEFSESGAIEHLNYQNPADLRRNYPRFFWDNVSPYIQDGMRYLRVTQEGKEWLASLFSHIFVEEHSVDGLGAERISASDTMQAVSTGPKK